MFICICNAIRESDLHDAALAHRGSAEELYCRMGRPPQCRQCLEDAEHLIDEARASTLVPACLPC